MYATFGHAARWTETPLPIVTKPMIGSPGTGLQHFESRTSTSSTPAIRIPELLRCTRRVGGRAHRRDVDDVRALEFFAHALRDRDGRRITESDGRVEIGRRRVVHLVRDTFERFAACRVGAKVLPHQLRFERFLAGQDVLFLAFFAEPLFDLVLRARGTDDAEPVK